MSDPSICTVVRRRVIATALILHNLRNNDRSLDTPMAEHIRTLRNIASFLVGLGALLLTPLISAPSASAMDGVDNLTVQKCQIDRKNTVERSFRAANLLIRYSWHAMRHIYDVEDRKRPLRKPIVDEYTGVKLNMPKILQAYSKVFGPYDRARWEIVNRKYAVATPLPLAVNAVCAPRELRPCNVGAIAFVSKVADKGFEATVNICPAFFDFTLAQVRSIKVYESASQLHLFRAGVIVHELMHTHLMSTSATHDIVYDYESIIELDPNEAIGNADSYHIFTLLAWGLGGEPKCIRAPSRFRNC
jgi:Lysine-specific metallo-endopeptidase